MSRQTFKSVWDALYPESSSYASYMEFKSALLKDAQKLAQGLPYEIMPEIEPETIESIISGEIDRVTVDDLLLIV